jgi:hypothetical protein
MSSKNRQPEKVAKQEVVDKSDDQQTLSDAETKAIIEANAIREQRIMQSSMMYNSAPSNNISQEERLEANESFIADISTAIDSKEAQLKPSGKFNVGGSILPRLNGFQKAKLRNEVRNLKTVRTQLQKECNQIEKGLKASYQKDNTRIDRSKVRINARKEGYHKRNGGGIQNALKKSVNGFSSEKLSSLKSGIAKVDRKKADGILMQAILKAPRHLHARVVSNTDARKDYLDYFRKLLKEGK